MCDRVVEASAFVPEGCGFDFRENFPPTVNGWKAGAKKAGGFGNAGAKKAGGFGNSSHKGRAVNGRVLQMARYSRWEHSAHSTSLFMSD